MDSKQILTADLLDLVFDRRNKDYGAYELRRHYNRRIARALLITGTFIGITLTTIALANKWTPETLQPPKEKIVTILELPPEEKIPEPPQEQPPVQRPEPVRTEIYATPRIVPNEDVEEPMAKVTDLDSAAIGTERIDGPPDVGISENIEATIGEKKDIIEKAPEPTGPYERVEVQAKFVGNWEKFLLRNLNGDVPVQNGAEPGRYQVVVQFVVDVDGSVSDIRPLTKVGYGMEEEAIRVLKKAMKWEPAIQNGRNVKAYRKQPITFEVTGE